MGGIGNGVVYVTVITHSIIVKNNTIYISIIMVLMSYNHDIMYF